MARQRKFTKTDLYQTTKSLLLEHGYEGFTISLVAEQLHVSRSAIYKYFIDKDHLITEYMVVEMNNFLKELNKIHSYATFEKQLHFLLDLILKNKEIHELIQIGQQIPNDLSEKAKINRGHLEKLHLDMYQNLEAFVVLGKNTDKIKAELPNSLVLGFIFQSISIPNIEHLPHRTWVESIKEIIIHGMFKNI